MVFAPGGENPKLNIDAAHRSVGIRLTKRNLAIPEILLLRRHFFQFETVDVLGSLKKSSDWTNAFGARRFQPRKISG
jgi:hypothetical protein